MECGLRLLQNRAGQISAVLQGRAGRRHDRLFLGVLPQGAEQVQVPAHPHPGTAQTGVGAACPGAAPSQRAGTGGGSC